MVLHSMVVTSVIKVMELINLTMFPTYTGQIIIIIITYFTGEITLHVTQIVNTEQLQQCIQ